MEIYQNLLIAEYILALLVFVLLFFVSAPYGKFLRKGWGMTMPAQYAWFIMELPALLVITYYFYRNQGWENPVEIVFLLIWQSHYLYRTLVYPFMMGGKNKPYPVILVLFAILFNTLNGSVNGYFLFEANTYEAHHLSSAAFLIGLLTFVGGYVINKQSDFILIALRKNAQDYQIPQGGFFRWISNPHYFGEIMQWLGWAVLTWSWAGLAFACFTWANLAPRALESHKWYQDHFENYPKTRKALVPFLW